MKTIKFGFGNSEWWQILCQFSVNLITLLTILKPLWISGVLEIEDIYMHKCNLQYVGNWSDVSIHIHSSQNVQLF